MTIMDRKDRSGGFHFACGKSHFYRDRWREEPRNNRLTHGASLSLLGNPLRWHFYSGGLVFYLQARAC